MHSTTALGFVIVGMLLIYWAVPAFRGGSVAGTGTTGASSSDAGPLARDTRPVFPYNPSPHQPTVRTGGTGLKLR